MIEMSAIAYKIGQWLFKQGARIILRYADKNNDGVIDSGEIESVLKEIVNKANGKFKEIKVK